MKNLRRLVANISDLDAAKADAKAARARLRATVEQLQARATPSHILDEALTTVRTRSTELIQDASRVARDRPGTVAAAVGGIAFLLARKPLGRLARKLLHRGEETADANRQFNRDAPPPARPRTERTGP